MARRKRRAEAMESQAAIELPRGGESEGPAIGSPEGSSAEMLEVRQTLADQDSPTPESPQKRQRIETNTASQDDGLPSADS